MDLAPADFLWSLFISSLTSYRRDTVLRPFPPSFLSGSKEKDFEDLLRVATACPCLEDVNSNSKQLDPKLLKLIRWVLNPKNFTLTHISKLKFPEIHKLVLDPYEKMKVSEPDYIFEVKYPTSQEVRFQNLKGNKRSLYAFHGSKIENFYSILNCGLRNNLNKAALFGEGTYLSSDLTLSMTYSPGGCGWDKSMFGSSLSCVALCEMIDHPDVKCTLKYNNTELPGDAGLEEDVPLDGNVQRSTTSHLNPPTSLKTLAPQSQQNIVHRTHRNRSRIAGSEGGEIPEKYFVVRNDDLVRVKYVLLYCPHAAHKRTMESNRKGFWSRHQFLLAMITYILFLFFIGMYNWMGGRRQ